MKVWILFSVANDYNQPDAAFEKLWWKEPTADDIALELGYIVDCEQVRTLLRGETLYDDGRWWISEFTKPE